MTRTEAPKDLEGRGRENWARTTPELPRSDWLAESSLPVGYSQRMAMIFLTMRPGDLAPDDPDLGAPLLRSTLVDVGDLLAEVEAARAVSYQCSLLSSLLP